MKQKKIAIFFLTGAAIVAAYHFYRSYRLKSQEKALTEDLKGFYDKAKSDKLKTEISPSDQTRSWVRVWFSSTPERSAVLYYNGRLIIFEGSKQIDWLQVNDNQITRNGQVVTEFTNLFQGIKALATT